MAIKLTNVPKEDCFAYINSGIHGCHALIELECRYGKKPCPFYKPKSEMKDYNVNDKKRRY